MTAPTAAPTAAAELDRQLAVLLAAGAPTSAGLTEAAFADDVRRLHALLPGDEPFVVALPHGLVPPLALVEQLRLRGRAGSRP